MAHGPSGVSRTTRWPSFWLMESRRSSRSRPRRHGEAPSGRLLRRGRASRRGARRRRLACPSTAQLTITRGTALAKPEAGRLRHDDLRRDVGARRQHGRDQSRPGLSRHRRARDEVTAAAQRAIASGPQPVRTGIGGRGRCGSAIAAHQLRFYGLEFDPDREVLVTTGATEAIAATILALCEPGDRGDHLRAVLRLLRGFDRARRCRPPRRPAAASRLVLRSGPARGCLHRPDAPRAVQLPSQPDRQSVHERRAGCRSPSCASSAM